MPKSKGAPAAPKAEIIKLDAIVNKDDLVTIKVSEFEQALLRAEREKKDAIAALEVENKALAEEVKKDVQAEAVRDLKANADKVAAGVAVLTGMTAEVVIKTEAPCQVNPDGPTKYVATVLIGDDRDKLAIPVSREVPGAVKAKLEKVAANEKAIDKATEDVITIRGNLSKIGTVERAARSELAKMKLREEGQEELLDSILKVDLPGLGLFLPAPAKK